MASAAAAARVVTVDVVSDTICPWCWVGKRRLERAVAAVRAQLAREGGPPLAVELRWHPFFLDPTLPKGGVDKLGRYTAKFGAHRVAAMLPRMQAVGAAEGIRFSFGGLTADTTNSHRVMALALRTGGAALQNAVNEEVGGWGGWGRGWRWGGGRRGGMAGRRGGGAGQMRPPYRGGWGGQVAPEGLREPFSPGWGAPPPRARACA